MNDIPRLAQFPWVEPLDYGRRAISLNELSEPKSKQTRGPVNKVTQRGLILAGMGLDSNDSKTRYTFRMKSKNFSTDDLAIRHLTSDHVRFHVKNMPDEKTVDRLFNDILDKGTYFWGSAQQNLLNITTERKWDLVCKIQALDSSYDEKSNPQNNKDMPKNDILLSQLDTLLLTPSKTSKALYQLEKLLRQKSFCDSFLDGDHFHTLVDIVPGIDTKTQYVHLGCFKTLMNCVKGRLEVLYSPILLEYFANTMINDNSALKVKLQASQLLVLLTYLDSEHGYDIVWTIIEKKLQPWLNDINDIVSNSESILNRDYGKTLAIRFPNPEQLLDDYLSSFLFLLNSIIEGYPTYDKKSYILEILKNLEIHKLFYTMEKFDSTTLKEQIKNYKNKEEDVRLRTGNETLVFPSLQYGTKLQVLHEKTHGTPLEQPFSDLMGSLSYILDKRTYSESIKLYKALSSILSYLLEKLESDFTDDDSIETTFQESMEKLIDNLQSDDIAKRAMLKLKESEAKVSELGIKLKELKEIKGLDENEVLDQLNEATAMLDTKDAELETLTIHNKNLQDQLRDEKIKLDHNITHQRYKPRTKNRPKSVFEILKGNTSSDDFFSKNLVRLNSHLIRESKRVTSLSSYLLNEDDNKGLNSAVGNTISPFYDANSTLEVCNTSGPQKYTSQNQNEGEPTTKKGHLYQFNDLSPYSGEPDKVIGLSNKSQIGYSDGNTTSGNGPYLQGSAQNSIISDISDINQTNAPNSNISFSSLIGQSNHNLTVSRSSLPLGNSSPGSSSVVHCSLLPPPPPPPFPSTLMNKTVEVEAMVVLPPPPPPAPPPPPMPSVLVANTVADSSISIPPPPPPPPMFTNQIHGNHLTDGMAPPPPQPLPPISGSVGITESTQSINSMHPLKLKQIHWDKVDVVEDTIWNDDIGINEVLSSLKHGGILEKVNSVFKIKDVAIKAKVNISNNIKPAVSSFLSRDLAQQFGINLHILSPYSVKELIEKVLSCDNEIIRNVSVLEFFNKEELTNISQSLARKYVPFSEDYLSGDPATKSSNELERSDQIFLGLCYNLRSYWQARSQCLLSIMTYEKDYYDLIYKLQKIDDAVQVLQNSTKLKSLLYIIYTIGNYMNKKSVEGIRLSSLTKLAFVKSSEDNNLSFLHFIEKIIRFNYPDVYSFIDDLRVVEDVGNISLEHLELECGEYSSKMDKIMYSLSEGKLSDPKKLHPDDQILKKVKYKATRAKAKSELLKDQLKLTEHDIDKIMQFFGENPKDKESKNQFFQNFIDFIMVFKKCAKENIEKEEMERVYEQRQRMVEQRNIDNKGNNKDEKDEDEDDAVDSLLSQLRGVNTKSDGLRAKRRSSRLFAKVDSKSSNEGVLLERTQALLNDIQKI